MLIPGEIEMRRHPARDAVMLENRRPMAGFCGVIGGGEPHGAGTDDGDITSGHDSVLPKVADPGSKFEYDVAIRLFPKRSHQRFAQRRQRHAEYFRPIDHLEFLGDHERGKLLRGKGGWRSKSA